MASWGAVSELRCERGWGGLAAPLSESVDEPLLHSGGVLLPGDGIRVPGAPATGTSDIHSFIQRRTGLAIPKYGLPMALAAFLVLFGLGDLAWRRSHALAQAHAVADSVQGLHERSRRSSESSKQPSRPSSENADPGWRFVLDDSEEPDGSVNSSATTTSKHDGAASNASGTDASNASSGLRHRNTSGGHATTSASADSTSRSDGSSVLSGSSEPVNAGDSSGDTAAIDPALVVLGSRMPNASAGNRSFNSSVNTSRNSDTGNASSARSSAADVEHLASADGSGVASLADHTTAAPEGPEYFTGTSAVDASELAEGDTTSALDDAAEGDAAAADLTTTSPDSSTDGNAVDGDAGADDLTSTSPDSSTDSNNVDGEGIGHLTEGDVGGDQAGDHLAGPSRWLKPMGSLFGGIFSKGSKKKAQQLGAHLLKRQKVCVTFSNETCRFPFYYKGKKYTGCTSVDAEYDDAGAGWCATSTDDRGNFFNDEHTWGNCDTDQRPECKAPKVCHTFSNDTCIFPFYYKQKRYDSCTDVDTPDHVEHRGWCATSTDNLSFFFEGKGHKWGTCDTGRDPDCKPPAPFTTNTTTTITTTTTTPYDCSDQFYRNWSPAKEMWCCNPLMGNVTCARTSTQPTTSSTSTTRHRLQRSRTKVDYDCEWGYVKSWGEEQRKFCAKKYPEKFGELDVTSTTTIFTEVNRCEKGYWSSFDDAKKWRCCEWFKDSRKSSPAVTMCEKWQAENPNASTAVSEDELTLGAAKDANAPLSRVDINDAKAPLSGVNKAAQSAKNAFNDAVAGAIVMGGHFMDASENASISATTFTPAESSTTQQESALPTTSAADSTTADGAATLDASTSTDAATTTDAKGATATMDDVTATSEAISERYSTMPPDEGAATAYSATSTSEEGGARGEAAATTAADASATADGADEAATSASAAASDSTTGASADGTTGSPSATSREASGSSSREAATSSKTSQTSAASPSATEHIQRAKQKTPAEKATGTKQPAVVMAFSASTSRADSKEQLTTTPDAKQEVERRLRGRSPH